MASTTPWELPFEIIHPETKHVVGRVYRDGLFIAFERFGEAYYALTDAGTVMHTPHKLFLRLTSDTPSHGMKAWGKLLNKAIFDECLCGDTEWTEEEPSFTRMRLPCDKIMEYMSVWPIEEDHAEDGSMSAKAWSFERFPFELPRIHAKGRVKFAYNWSSKTFVEQRFTAYAELVLDYEVPTSLRTIKEHEERLRSFFDFIWFRGHKAGMLYLHNGDRLAMFHRRESVSPEVRAAHCLDLRDILTQENLAAWIERWFDLPEAVRMAIEPVVSIARNPGTITDFKFVMAAHALASLHIAYHGQKGLDMDKRFHKKLGRYWGKKRDLEKEKLKAYILRVVWTRNEIVKAARHEDATDASLLTPSERARAYFEMLLLHRALFLEVMGIEQARIDTFVEAGFGKIGAQEFRYFRD
jgi:hypothetical protein